jgi:hypothetical protein
LGRPRQSRPPSTSPLELASPTRLRRRPRPLPSLRRADAMARSGAMAVLFQSTKTASCGCATMLRDSSRP